MPQKVIDIFPPEYKEKEDRLPEVAKKSTKELKSPKEKRSNPVKTGLILVLVVLVASWAIFQFGLARLEIEIFPKTRVLSLQQAVIINEHVKEPDFSLKVIPGKFFTQEKEFSQQFQATGQVLKKAHGKVRIYNDYSSRPQRFLARTRLMSSSGKIFRIPKAIVIPGKTIKNGKSSPGSVEVEVVAAEGGKDYNIGPTTFSIPGLKGTKLFYHFYGKSFSPMTGGGKYPQITETDLKKAKLTLTKDAFAEGKASLESGLPPDVTGIQETLSQKVTKALSSKKAGTEAKSFSFQINVESKIIAFKKKDVEDFAKDYLLSQVKEGERLKEGSLKMSWKLEGMKLDEGKVFLDLNFSGKVFSTIDEEAVKEALKGKRLGEIKFLLKEQPQVESIKVKAVPFWLRRVPQDTKRIEIKLNPS